MSLTLTKNIFDKYKNNHEVFIETGTFKGGSVELAIECNFKKIYTIDISKQYQLECQNKFQIPIQKNQIELLYGDSIDILPTLLNDLNESCLFWLDSHFDLHSDICGKYECPLLHELNIIKRSKLNTHTIMIDDLRIFKTQKEWGVGILIDNIIETLFNINPNYQLFYENGWAENDILIAKV
jgi:hypothetical protein